MVNKDLKDSRRQFLKNTSLSILSIAAFPTVLKSASSISLQDFSNSCNESTEDAYGQGPFYSVNAPFIQNNKLANSNEVGTRIILSGQVYNLDCSEVIPNTEIDIWHADDEGSYDNQGYNLRGKATTNNQGFYVFESIKPGFYLNGSNFRPSHIHFKITPPGFNTLITQLYFQGDPYIPTDAAASITSGSFDATHRIIPLVLNSNGELEGTWDIVIDGNGVSIGTNNIHLDRGMIYGASPNPFQDMIEINYGVFQKAKVCIVVYDIRGQIVATLDEKTLYPEKYSVSWEPSRRLPSGHYFISIKMNDLQVHYIKVIRQ
ncbi:MAG: Chlorocatechol 1,2-dioxygenase [Owenweeksia sp. TMED14]|nr:MAG: Chlorocatechol 1,2-dioxygenase [Owenweeksia sp. TMED14]|tara:strand:+ start:629 stop:1582 length:954 start_codon:yes stop_codon:yes gene_type:complete